MLTVEMREIILVTTQTVSVPPTANMQAPGVNGARPTPRGFPCPPKACRPR